MAMAVARQGGTAIASKARITRPPNSRSHPLCCGMGWLDSAAYRIGPHINRYINDPAPG